MYLHNMGTGKLDKLGVFLAYMDLSCKSLHLGFILCALKKMLHVYSYFCVGLSNVSKEERPGPYGLPPRRVGKGRAQIEVPEAFRFFHHGKSLPTGGRGLDCV